MILAVPDWEIMLDSKVDQTFKKFLAGSTLFLTTLSCRPVVTVGWGEMLLLALVAAIILGPLLIRLARRFGGNQKRNVEGENGHQESD
jgi:hypothetical protein